MPQMPGDAGAIVVRQGRRCDGRRASVFCRVDGEFRRAGAKVVRVLVGSIGCSRSVGGVLSRESIDIAVVVSPGRWLRWKLGLVCASRCGV